MYRARQIEIYTPDKDNAGAYHCQRTITSLWQQHNSISDFFIDQFMFSGMNIL